MQLERDQFIVDYDSNRIAPAGLIKIVKDTGYTASVVTGDEPVVAESGDSGSRDDPIFIEALARAKKENKPLVLDFYAGWCAPCLKMLKTTIPSPEVAPLLDACVFLKVDTDKHSDLAKAFGVVGLPDLRILDSNGNELRKMVGFQDADALAEVLMAILGDAKRE